MTPKRPRQNKRSCSMNSSWNTRSVTTSSGTTPRQALAFTWRLDPLLVVYDCMDELSALDSAKRREAELLRLADVVFTSRHGLDEAKRRFRHNVHSLPDRVDLEHFRNARREIAEPVDQARIGRPRLGFSGVIDEHLDLELLAAISEARADWQIVMIGPVVEIAPSELPRRPNIHYLGDRIYKDLPAYFSGWDVAVAPFSRGESTRMIAPVETLEYLAAGVLMVSTSIRDVELVYGRRGPSRSPIRQTTSSPQPSV